MKFSIYLAGKVPKGEEVGSFRDWRKEFMKLTELKRKDFPRISGIVYLDPNTFLVSSLKAEDFFGRDVHMVSMCSALVVDATAKLGAGTAQEMLIAKYYRKPVISVVPKNSHYWRKSYYVHNDIIEYRHPFIFSTSDIVVKDFGQAALWLLRYFSGKIKPKIKGIEMLDDAQKHYLENHLHKDELLKGWKKEMEGQRQ